MLEPRRRRRRIGKTAPGSSKSYSSFEEDNDFSFSQDKDSRSNNFEDSPSYTSGSRSISTNDISKPSRSSMGSFTSSYDDFSAESRASLKYESCLESVSSNTSTRSRKGPAYASKGKIIRSDHSETFRSPENDEKVRGAITDVYAVQDAGSYRLGYEHCSYLCSTICTINPESDECSTTSIEQSYCFSQQSQSSLSEGSPHSIQRLHSYDTSNSEGRRMKRKVLNMSPKKQHHTSITANAACELANMMASSKQRSALLMSSSTCRGDSENEICFNALNSILDALASAPIFPCPSLVVDRDRKKSLNSIFKNKTLGTERDDHVNSSMDENKLSPATEIRQHPILRTRSSRTKRLRTKNEEQKNSTTALQLTTNKIKSTSDQVSSNLSCHDNQTALALSAVAYFLSLESSSSSFIRNSILKHHRGLLGISRLVHFDSLLSDYIEKSSLLSEVVADIEDDTKIFKSDPTSKGRKKRKRRKIQKQLCDVTNTKTDRIRFDAMESIDENKLGKARAKKNSIRSTKGRKYLSSSSPLSFTSGSTLHENETYWKSLQNALTKVEISLKGNKMKATDLTAGFMALNAMMQITTRNNDDDDENNKNIAVEECEDDENENNVNNPFFANHALRESKSLSMLAHAMASALSSAKHCISDIRSSSELNEKCTNLSNLNIRIDMLVSIIDGACCLTPLNRKAIVDDTNLIESLIHLVKGIINLESPLDDEKVLDKSSNKKCIDDLLLSSLQTLTSLSHENFPAGLQLLHNIENKSEPLEELSNPLRKTGFGVIFDLLSATVTKKIDANCPCDEKRTYDTIIFCLNTLTNVAETSELLERVQRELLSAAVLVEEEEKLEDDDCSFDSKESLSIESKETILAEKPALQWLSEWLVKETETFRDLIVKGTFGKKNESDTEKTNGNQSSEERMLMKHEEESLVLAGNGFVLLACLMKDSSSLTTNKRSLSAHVRTNILSKMPSDEDTEVIGVTFMIKTLKAFLNFYHYSIGDLSVAVVEPVLKLISELKKL